MSVQGEPCWNYPATSATMSPDQITFTTVPFPMSPTSISPAAVSSPPSVTLPSPVADATPQSTSRPRNRRHNSKISSTSSSLPNPKELSIEDDWTRVKCPKEKKRIQNRVAQRTYRHRMKARLGELQARLDSHERQRTQHDGNGAGEVPSGIARAPVPLDPTTAVTNGVVNIGMNSLSRINSMMSTHSVGETSPSPLSNDQQRLDIAGLPNSMQDHTMDDSEPAFYSHNAQYLHSPPNSHPSPQGTNGLLSPPCRPEFDQSNKVSQDFVLDCLRFQTQLLNRLNTLDQDPNYLDQPQYNANNSSIPQMMDGMTREPMNCMGTFTPSAAQINNIDFSFDSPRDDWRTEAFGLKTRQSPSPIGTMSVPQLPDAAIPTLEPMLDAGVLSRSTRASSAPSRTDERLENVMRHAHAAGFDTFEDMATSYYQTTFKNSSPLSTEQHLSRSKRLPRVISSVYQASESWPHWERHGFRDEIVKTATTMLGSEASEKSATLSSNLSPLLENLKTKDASKIAATLETIKQTIQQELPHSWALNSGLAKEMGAGWQANDGNAAMATIMLQQLSGKIPKEQLLRVVEACL